MKILFLLFLLASCTSTQKDEIPSTLGYGLKENQTYWPSWYYVGQEGRNPASVVTPAFNGFLQTIKNIDSGEEVILSLIKSNPNQFGYTQEKAQALKSLSEIDDTAQFKVWKKISSSNSYRVLSSGLIADFTTLVDSVKQSDEFFAQVARIQEVKGSAAQIGQVLGGSLPIVGRFSTLSQETARTMANFVKVATDEGISGVQINQFFQYVQNYDSLIKAYPEKQAVLENLLDTTMVNFLRQKGQVELLIPGPKVCENLNPVAVEKFTALTREAMTSSSDESLEFAVEIAHIQVTAGKPFSADEARRIVRTPAQELGPEEALLQQRAKATRKAFCAGGPCAGTFGRGACSTL